MTPNDTMLYVDTIDPYLPRVYEMAKEVGLPDDPQMAPPERVWVPADTLPLEHCEICNGSDVAHDGSPGCGSCRGGARPLAVGDRVSLVTDCPEGHEPASVWHPCETCRGSGVVRVGSATVTEIRDVTDSGEETHAGEFIILPDGRDALVPAHRHDPGGVAARPFPGDWSTARFGVRLDDVTPVEYER